MSASRRRRARRYREAKERAEHPLDTLARAVGLTDHSLVYGDGHPLAPLGLMQIAGPIPTLDSVEAMSDLLLFGNAYIRRP